MGDDSPSKERTRFLGRQQPPGAQQEQKRHLNANMQMLLQDFGSFGKAWQKLDKDGSNRLTWNEFTQMCEEIKLRRALALAVTPTNFVS